MQFELQRDNEQYYQQGENVCELHLHRSVEILYILHGEKQVILGNHEYTLKANDLLVCPPYQAHTYKESENSEQIVATLFTEFCPQFSQLCKLAEPKTHVFHDKKKELLPYFLQLENAANAVLYSALVNYILGVFLKHVDFISIEEKNEEDFTTKIVEFIHEHYQENLTLTSLSQKFGYSPNYFSGLFNRYLGTGVSQYLNSVRIQKSIALLQEKSVEEIAYACGYNSPQQYYLNFKKIHGCAPKEYLYKEL